MFGLAGLTLPLLIGIVSVVVGIIRFIYTTFFSENAKAEAILAWAEKKKTELQFARERLKEKSQEIDAKPDKTGKDLEDDINRTFGDRC